LPFSRADCLSPWQRLYTLHTFHLIIYRHRGRCVAQIPQISANRRRTSSAAQHSYNIIIIICALQFCVKTFSPYYATSFVLYIIVQYTTVFETSWHGRQRLQRSCPRDNIYNNIICARYRYRPYAGTLPHLNFAFDDYAVQGSINYNAVQMQCERPTAILYAGFIQYGGVNDLINIITKSVRVGKVSDTLVLIDNNTSIMCVPKYYIIVVVVVVVIRRSLPAWYYMVYRYVYGIRVEFS